VRVSVFREKKKFILSCTYFWTVTDIELFLFVVHYYTAALFVGLD